MGECGLSCNEENSGIADAIHHYWKENEDFTTFLVLDDLNQPYDCVQWGNFGEDNIPLIVNGDEFPITDDWFGFDNYPWNVLINPDMEIVSMQNTNPSVWSMAVAVGDALGGCVDELASNFGENINCLYEDNNFTSFEIDILPVLDYWGCTGCHNNVIGGSAGGLKMHNYESIMAGSNSGPIIVSSSENSVLLNVLNQVNNATPFSDMWGTSFDSSSTLNKNLIYRISDWITEGALEFTNYGCTNIDACNYDSSATTNDGSCAVEDCTGICGGPAEVDNCGECVGGDTGLTPCVQDCALIWGGDSTTDLCGVCDGDNSSCTGCTDDVACNYSSTATISGECEYSEVNYDCSGNCNVEVDCEGTCGGSLVALDYCADTDGDGLGAGDIISYCLADLPTDGSFVLDCSDTEPDCATNDIDECDECGCLSIIDNIPEEFSINNIYPNPFNPVVNIEYSLSTPEMVKISIFGLNGQIVDQLFSGNQSVGNYQITWDASAMSSGIYIIMIQSGNVILSDQLILLK